MIQVITERVDHYVRMGVLVKHSETSNNRDIYPWILDTDPRILDCNKHVKWLKNIPYQDMDVYSRLVYNQTGIKK